VYFASEIQLVCILCNWNTFVRKILKVTENNTSVGCIRFNAVLGIMFEQVFLVFLFIYRILNCHSHSVSTKPRNMSMFLLFIKRILIYWLIDWLIDWLTHNESWLYFVFQLLSLKVFYFEPLVRSNWQK